MWIRWCLRVKRVSESKAVAKLCQEHSRPRAGLIRRVPADSALRLAVVAFLVVRQPLAPATITVSGGCTLVDAITAANTDSPAGSCPSGSGADEIQLTADVELTSIDNATVFGPNGLPEVTSEITLEGSGRTIARSSASGTPDFRILSVARTGDLSLYEVTVSNGRDIRAGANGGGILSSGRLALTDSTVSGNTAEATGDYGSAYGGGISSYYYNGSNPVLEITNSTISNNTALASGSIHGFGRPAHGGGVFTLGSILTLTNSTVSQNLASAPNDGVARGGGITSYESSGSIENSTISSNEASSSISSFEFGGGIFTYNSPLAIANSTIARNSGIGISSYGPPLATLTASIIADNTPSNCGAVSDGGANFSDETTCGAGFGALTGFDTSLADNGGSTMTHALLAGSSAIDAAGACGLPEDQRGAGRVGDCDSGAFEFLSCPDLVLSDDTILGTERRENCQKILVGPNFSVAGGGDLSLGAGKSVELGNGTSVQIDGQLTIEIDPDLQVVLPPP